MTLDADRKRQAIIEAAIREIQPLLEFGHEEQFTVGLWTGFLRGAEWATADYGYTPDTSASIDEIGETAMVSALECGGEDDFSYRSGVMTGVFEFVQFLKDGGYRLLKPEEDNVQSVDE